MTPERWRAVKAVVQDALAHPPAARPAFVAVACGDDAELRAEVESLLAGPDTGAGDDDFLAPPAAAAVGAAGDTDAAGRLTAALAGRYAVERELGRGGMATVYLARDLRHRRPVAIKVLHPELSAALGPERFRREIETTAGLQHAHILPLFDSGEACGRLYYVMPYVAGDTLRARLAREGPLPVGDAVRLAIEVADALQHAHQRGVVHRDVKPENILLQGGRDGGHAVVADFGIALAVQEAGGTRMTRTGLSVGTPQYMPPEQAMGDRAVDARADVYALGAVLYEMLAGEPPFAGPSARAVLAKVITEEPKSLAAVRRHVPAHVDAAVLTALAKLPADRFPSAAAFAAALADPAGARGGATAGSLTAARAAPRRPAPRWRSAFLAAGLVASAAGAWALGRASGRGAASAAGSASERGPVRFVIQLDSVTLTSSPPAISPDGRVVVYAADGPDGLRLYTRRLGDLTVQPIAGTEGGDWPFFSPDGAWIAFSSNGAIRKVRLSGGTSTLVTDIRAAVHFGGGWWGENDIMYFAVVPSGALYRVPAGGGIPARVPVADTTGRMLYPQLLPGGRALLVTTLGKDFSTARVGALDLTSGGFREFAPGTAARYAAGHVVYAGTAGQLYRQPFDVDRLAPRGAAEEISSGAEVVERTEASFATSPGGVLVYRASRGRWALAVTDRGGRALHVVRARKPWSPRFAPDGGRVAYGAYAPGRDSTDIWITDPASGATQRLTADANDNNDPQWSRDATRLVYEANAPGGMDLLVQPLDGGPAQPVLRRPGTQWVSDWVPDGSALLFTDVTWAGDMAIWVRPMDGGPPRPYVDTPARESGARASPDGRWVAYTSDETGRNEVYVQSYPVPGRKTLVSAGGGTSPAWRGDGRELYYWRAGQLVAADVAAGRAGAPLVVRGRTPLFRAPYVENVHANYDVSADGKRFVLVTRDAPANRLVVALDALGTRRAR